MTDTTKLRDALEWAAPQAFIRNAPEYSAILRDFIERGLPFLGAAVAFAKVPPYAASQPEKDLLHATYREMVK